MCYILDIGSSFITSKYLGIEADTVTMVIELLRI